MCGVHKRTTYRDLIALESELGVPVWEEGSRRGIAEGYLLPPIHFTLPEALNVFLACRLMLSYERRYDPNIASTFTKLNSIVPSPLRAQIQQTLDWMERCPRDERYLLVLATIAEAWVSQHQVRILYRALGKQRASERTIEPYFIEPAVPGHSCYVIGYCHRTKQIRTFKIERIESIQVTSEPYIIPPDFDANAYLSSSWGVIAEGEVKTIRLRFSAQIARIMEETIWHPSQVLERQSDGSVLMTFRITDTVELQSWILGWGGRVEVLEPKDVREKIVEAAKDTLKVYQKSNEL